MCKIPRELIKDMVAWRRDIHQHPEFGFEESRTADLVAKTLVSLGLEVKTGIGTTGVVGKLSKGKSDRAIGVRAEMDCLLIGERNTFSYRSAHEGKMHACGHDGHTSMLLGAASSLSKHENFDGTVYFIFQPAEEHGKGAQAMIDDGLFERCPVDAVFAIHNMPGIPAGKFAVRSGTIMSSEDNFEIVVGGRGAHASMPHQGIDPIVVASQIVLGLQTIVSRSCDPVDILVVSVTDVVTDGTRNVSPSTVTLRGDVRTFDAGVQTMVKTRIGEIAHGICRSYGANCDLRYTHDFVPTVNSEAETKLAIKAARAALGDENVLTDVAPATTSEDFARMLAVKPGCYALIGNGDEPGRYALHNPYYDFNDEILNVGALFWIELVTGALPLHV